MMRDSQGRFIRKIKIHNYQTDLVTRLNILFGGCFAESEWSSMNNERGLSIYSPRIDVAVGPFATQEQYDYQYDRMLNRSDIGVFTRSLYDYNRRNIRLINDDFVYLPEYEDIIHMNHNARCFMAIEIENNVSRKHLMGGAINGFCSAYKIPSLSSEC